MKSTPSYLIQGNNIIVVIDGNSHTINKDTHIAYTGIVKALAEKDWSALCNLVDPKSALITYGNGNVGISGNTILWKGKPFHNSLATRMMDMLNDGLPIDPMVKFMENLMENPSERSIEQLYGFLEKNSLPITEDGYFLAFKKVRKDYKDIHSGTISNALGEVIEMDRNLVDDDPESYCSTGLHFCSHSYLNSFGSVDDPIMVIKINPADVVSIPKDYNGAKGRCCKYHVVAQVRGDAKDAFASAVAFDVGKTVTPVDPVVKWEFPKVVPSAPKPAPSAKAPTKKAPKAKSVTKTATDRYNVYRVSNGDLVLFDVTLAVAQSKVAAHVKGKKAKLEIRKV